MERVLKIGNRVIPIRLKEKVLRSKFFNQVYARHLASSSRRLDKCAQQIASIFQRSGLSGKIPIQGKICTEVGSGWVLSHAVVLFLLGAKRVIATDIERIAHPSYLYQSVHTSEVSNIRDILSPFVERHMIDERLKTLLKISSFSFKALKKLGVDYVAPIDLALRPLGTRTDFVFSLSVLEHIPIGDVLPFMKNLTCDLNKDGRMIHVIHLEDHKDAAAPFAFLSEPREKFTREVQTIRGNRIRRSQWKAIFSQIRNVTFRFVFEQYRLDKLPALIDPSIQFVDRKDLAASHLIVLFQKVGK